MFIIFSEWLDFFCCSSIWGHLHSEHVQLIQSSPFGRLLQQGGNAIGEGYPGDTPLKGYCPGYLQAHTQGVWVMFFRLVSFSEKGHAPPTLGNPQRMVDQTCMLKKSTFWLQRGPAPQKKPHFFLKRLPSEVLARACTRDESGDNTRDENRERLRRQLNLSGMANEDPTSRFRLMALRCTNSVPRSLYRPSLRPPSSFTD